MYILKKRFEDFLVEEVYEGKILPKGPFLLVKMQKTNWNTIHAVEQIAKRLRIPLKSIGYAGLKDKQGTTTQFISIANKTWEQINFLRIKDIELEHVGYVNAPIGLGSNLGNKFSITVRNLTEPLQPITTLLNYFDDQRFGGKRPNTHLIGKLLLLEKFEEAAKILICAHYPTEESEHQKSRMELSSSWPDIVPEQIPAYLTTERRFVEYLQNYPGDYKGAFYSIPKRLLTLYVHAYQSYLYNVLLDKNVEEVWGYTDIIDNKLSLGTCSQAELPLVGYDYGKGIPSQDPAVMELLEKEGIKLSMFEHQELLKTYTSMRKTQISLKITVGPLEPDSEFPSQFCQRVEFVLPSGSYATAVIKQMAAHLDP